MVGILYNHLHGLETHLYMYIQVLLGNQWNTHLLHRYFHHHIQRQISFHHHKIQYTIQNPHHKRTMVYIVNKHSYFSSWDILEDRVSISFAVRHKMCRHYIHQDYQIQLGWEDILYHIECSQACTYMLRISIQNLFYEHIFHSDFPQLHYSSKHTAYQQLKILHGKHIELHPKKHLVYCDILDCSLFNI